MSCVRRPQALSTFSPTFVVFGRQIAGRIASTSLDLASLILDEPNVAVVPGEAFGAPGHLRLSYALSDHDLDEGMTRTVIRRSGIFAKSTMPCTNSMQNPPCHML